MGLFRRALEYCGVWSPDGKHYCNAPKHDDDQHSYTDSEGNVTARWS